MKNFGFSGNSNFFKDKAEFLSNYFYHLCTVVGVLFMTLGADYAYTNEETYSIIKNDKYNKLDAFISILFNNWLLLFLGVIILLIGTIGSYTDSKNLMEENKKLLEEQKSIDSLRDGLDSSKEEMERLNSLIIKKHQELVKNWLKMLSLEISLSVDERLTIYYENKDVFTLLSRYSQNKLYDNIHRQKFPLNNGIISLSWARNTYKNKNIPQHKNNSEEYISYMKNKYDYEEDVVKSITMKSNMFYGIAIQEADENIGVLLYEMISSDGQEFDTKCSKIYEHYKKYETYLIKYVKDAILLDRTYNIDSKIDISIENEVLSKLGGKK